MLGWLMGKRDIKAKRWARRREKRKYGAWYWAQQQFLIVTGRRPGKESLREIWNREYATAPIVNPDESLRSVTQMRMFGDGSWQYRDGISGLHGSKRAWDEWRDIGGGEHG